jgi:DNA (cytosine-5)-methyltransferase 1
MKILNLYACLGGNRYKWGDEHEITAVELDPELARIYQERFPNDIVIVADAHQYLLDHYKEFDFIWSSPPCPTHSKSRFWAHSKTQPVYPDMTLYEEIIFLQHHFNGKFCVENVNPYYDLLIPGQKRGRHIYWTNFVLPIFGENDQTGKMNFESKYQPLIEFHKLEKFDYKGTQDKLKILRNLVGYEAGKIILDTAMGIVRNLNTTQQTLEL